MNPLKKSPVALFVYNRPTQAEQTFAQIKAYRPLTLFVLSDGPKNSDVDRLNVARTREIFTKIDWPCDVVYRFADHNLGCRASITTGLAFIFEQVQECIILEDDCLPDLTFFDFCTALLERYRDNPAIMTIGGHQPIHSDKQNEDSYHYSKYPSTWGWATWRRAYRNFDPSLSNWVERQEHAWLLKYLGKDQYARYWSYMLSEAHKGADHWDYAWAYHCWKNNGLSIRPTVNLIKNIGFGPTATHTTETLHPFGQCESSVMPFPLRHPALIEPSNQRESKIEELLFSGIRRRQLSHIYQAISQRRADSRHDKDERTY